MNSLEKIRETIDEVVAQVMLSHADQLRNQVTERVKVVLDADAEHLHDVESQLREKSQHAEQLQQELADARKQTSDKQQQVENLERQLHELETLSAQASEQAHKSEEDLRNRAASLQQSLNLEIEQLHNRTRELEQLLESTTAEVRQLREQETELKKRAQDLQKELERARAESERTLRESLEAKEAELTAQIKAIQAELEQTRKEGEEQLQAKERDLLDQVHLLEELLVQGQQAREQQLEAKDQQLKQTVGELNQQISKLQESHSLQGNELQQRLQAAEKERDEVRKQAAELQTRLEKNETESTKTIGDLTEREQQWKQREGDLVTQQLELERVNADHQGLQTIWEQRERELTAQLADFEKKVGDYAAAEKDWHKREDELLGHRDKVLSSSAEAAHTSQRELQMAQEEQGRLQTQIDLLMEELEKVRNSLELKQEEFTAREQELNEEIARLKGDGSVAPEPVREASKPAAVPAAPGRSIEPAVARIRAAKSQTEILKALLEGAAGFAARAGILVSHGRTASGWAGRGFKEEAAFRRISVDCSQGMAAKVMQSRTSVQGKAVDLDPRLGEKISWPADEEVFLFPLLIRDRVAALLYADAGTSGKAIARSSLEGLVLAASAWLDEVSRSKPGSPEPEPAAPPVEKPKAAAAAAAAPAPPATEQGDPSHQKARRFAKLLVDEIKLYNKEEVDAGRKHHDLYDRLRDSIDKSRASYDKRWGKAISGTDYFKEELVRNLAENDVAVLGSNFPS